MRDILDALESIHTNKKKPMDIKKELNKKPAVMKALSLEDTEELEEGVNDVDKILQLTNELYNELVDFQNEETDENVEDLIGHLAEFKAKLEGDAGSFGESAVREDAGEDEKVVDMLRNIKQHLDNHPNMSEHPSLVALDQLADDLESGDKPADYESVSEDKFDGYKIHRLGELQKKIDDVAKDIRLLSKTDAIPSATGAGDLTDQITTMNKAVTMLQDVIERANSIVPDPLKNYDGTPKTEETVEEDCSCETELTTNSEEQKMETNQKDTVEVAVEDLARVLELAGLGKEVIKAEAEAEQQAEAEATEEATTEAPNEVELDEYSNSPDEDYFDADTQLNKLSGGLNGPKKQLKKEYPGDNPLAVDLETKLAKMLSDM